MTNRRETSFAFITIIPSSEEARPAIDGITDVTHRSDWRQAAVTSTSIVIIISSSISISDCQVSQVLLNRP